MRPELLDQIGKTLSIAGSRRGLLQVLAASPLAALSALRVEESRGKKRKCKRCMSLSNCKPTQICDGRCCRTCTVCASGCKFTSVQAAIDAAKKGATIRICAGTYPEHDITIGKSLTLAGAGAEADDTQNTVLDAGGQGRVMAINQATVTLRGLRLTGGDDTNRPADTFGGGISNSGKLTLDRCTVTGNRAGSSFGGGVYTGEGASLALKNSHVTNNVAVTVDVASKGGAYTTPVTRSRSRTAA
jgi:pectin methylesterase-like acyl-CoA thioesterase